MPQRVLKLRGDQERRRFFLGVAVDDLCGSATAAIVAATGRGWEARFEVASHVVEEVPRETRTLYQKLSTSSLPSPSMGGGSGVRVHPTDVALLGTQLAEVEAAALERLAAIECDVWPHVLLAGVVDPGLWRHGPSGVDYLGLCDSARLAELAGLNIVDAFPARDMALDGRGSPLDVVPLWLLLRHPQVSRLLVTLRPSTRAVYLPASRDETAVLQIEAYELESQQAIVDWLRSCLNSQSAKSAINSSFKEPSAASPVDELLMLTGGDLLGLQANLAKICVLDEASLGVSFESLPAACAAILAMLHIDQARSNLPHLTGATTPRVLGRLTPGNAYAWNRLLRDLAFVRPLITPLRAAI